MRPCSLGQRDTSDRRPQSPRPNLPFPRNQVACRCVSLSQPHYYFLCCPSAFCTPHPCCECSSHFLTSQAQGTFRLWLDPHSWILWHWWSRLQSSDSPKCLSKQLCQQTSNTRAVLTSHCSWYPLFKGYLIATSFAMPLRTSLALYFLVLGIESKALFS